MNATHPSVSLELNTGTELLTVATRFAEPDAMVLTVCGDVDLSTSPLLEKLLLAHLDGTVQRVVVDLTGVGFLSVSGLTVLVTVRDAAVAAGISPCLVAGARPVLLPLTITHLDRAFDIYPALDDALVPVGHGRDG